MMKSPGAGHGRAGAAGHVSILATFDDDDLPDSAQMSHEVDILPIGDDNDEVQPLADLIEGVAGEFSPYEELHGFSIDGVDLTTSALPDGWRERLVKVQSANTAAPGGEHVFTGWCLDKEDLCVAKICAFREKDREFVRDLLQAGLSTERSLPLDWLWSPSASQPPQPMRSAGSRPVMPGPGVCDASSHQCRPAAADSPRSRRCRTRALPQLVSQARRPGADGLACKPGSVTLTSRRPSI